MWGSLDPNTPESWPEDPAAKAWKDREAIAALQAQEAAKPARTWGDTWNDIKSHLSPGVAPAQFGSLSPVAPNDDPSVVAAARMRASVRPVSGRAEGPLTKLAENIVPGLAEGVASGFTAPGDAVAGKLPMWGPEGNTSLEAVRRGFDTASLAGGGAVGGAASRAVPQLAADAAKSGAPIAAAAHSAAPFYSTLDEVAAAAKMGRAPGAQWDATLRNAGVKPEEMQVRGVDKLLAERRAQPITKEELRAHLQANPLPEIKPVDKANPKWEDLTPKQQYAAEDMWKGQGGRSSYYVDPAHFYDAYIRPDPENLRSIGIDNPTRYSDYQLPGGDNYRERLMTLPGEEPKFGVFKGEERLSPEDFASGDAAREWARDARYNNPDGIPRIPDGATVRQVNDVPEGYKSNHWDEPNILVHRRSTDRVIGDGEPQYVVQNVRSGNRSQPFKTEQEAWDYVGTLPRDMQQWMSLKEQPGAGVRSLHAEEIQSDWHQAGRKQGYPGDADKAKAAEQEARIAFRNGVKNDLPDEQLDVLRQNLANAERAEMKTRDTVPDGPFKKTWHELAAKDMLREAAEGDYPRISWTAGGSNPTNPKNLNQGGGAPNAERADAYARADKGMQGFYDKMMPDYLNKLGKKYGVEVKRTSIKDEGGMTGSAAMNRMGIAPEEQAAFWERLNSHGSQAREDFMKMARDKGHDVFYMDVPEAMRNDIKSRGFSMFEDASPGQVVATAGALNERAGQKAGLDVGRGLEGVSGGAESVAAAEAAAARSAGAYEPLAGLPRKPLPVGGQPYVPGPIATVHDIAQDYMKSTGRPYVRQDRYHPIDEAKSTAIAKAFDEMKHAPDDPKVKASYKAMIDETAAQYDAAVKSGIKFEPIAAGAPDPYAATPRLAAKDVQENKHLWYFPTESGYGTEVGNPGAVKAISDNPMLQPTGRKDIHGKEMLANDLFRVVHDFYGHLKEGYGFRAAGEDNAWRTHARMYSDEALPAMTSETRGQNSWVNYGPYGEKNRTASAGDTRYADQKVGLLPDWVWKDEMPPSAPAIAKGRERFVDESGRAIQSPAYTKEAQAINKEIAAGPKGEGPIDLSAQSQTPGVEQRPLERTVPPRGVSERMQDAMQNRKVSAGLEESMRAGAGVQDWYHTDPIRQEFLKTLGKEQGETAFKQYMDLVAATSPRSDVPTNIRNASHYYTGGDPDKPNPYPYGHVAQNLHKQNVRTVSSEAGWNPLQNPKPASFAENLRGNLEPVTVDTHAFRNIAMRTGDPRFLETSYTQKIDKGREPGPDSLAMRYGEIKTDAKGQKIVTFRPQQLVKDGVVTMKEAKKIPSFWASKPKDNEYAAAERMFRAAGNKVGMRPADAQAAAWSGAGEMTGLGTVGTHTFNELMNERIMFTAKMRGEKPEKVLRDFIRKGKPLLSDTSAATAFGSLDGQEQR